MWDAFGLPAEMIAIKKAFPANGMPKIRNFKMQLQYIGDV